MVFNIKRYSHLLPYPHISTLHAGSRGGSETVHAGPAVRVQQAAPDDSRASFFCSDCFLLVDINPLLLLQFRSFNSGLSLRVLASALSSNAAVGQAVEILQRRIRLLYLGPR